MALPVIVSRCLIGGRCRYDGRVKPSIAPKLAGLGLPEGAVRWVPVCPEVDGGLPVPRPPCEIEPGCTAADVLEGRARIVSVEGRDCTGPYSAGADAALAAARSSGAAVALLKARSPACGSCGVYDGTFSGRLVPGRGIAAERLARAGLQIFSEEACERFVAWVAEAKSAEGAC